MLVAIPTAIPEAPFTSKLGNLAGNTVGSCRESSKFKLVIDGILIDIGQHFLGQLLQPCLGITHCRRIVAIYGTISFPGHRPTDNGGSTPGPYAPWYHKRRSRHGGDIYPSPHPRYGLIFYVGLLLAKPRSSMP